MPAMSVLEPKVPLPWVAGEGQEAEGTFRFDLLRMTVEWIQTLNRRDFFQMWLHFDSKSEKC